MKYTFPDSGEKLTRSERKLRKQKIVQELASLVLDTFAFYVKTYNGDFGKAGVSSQNEIKSLYKAYPNHQHLIAEAMPVSDTLIRNRFGSEIDAWKEEVDKKIKQQREVIITHLTMALLFRERIMGSVREKTLAEDVKDVHMENLRRDFFINRPNASEEDFQSAVRGF